MDDTVPIRKDRCENKISLDEKELLIPVKRKVSSDSDHYKDDSNYSPVPTKIRRFSEDEDGEIADSPNLSQREDNEVESSDVRSSSIGEHFQNVNENNPNSGEKKSSDGDLHLISQIPPTEKKKWPQKPCIICRRYGVRHDTRYYCNFCNTALCKEPCFREYHEHNIL